MLSHGATTRLIASRPRRVAAGLFSLFAIAETGCAPPSEDTESAAVTAGGALSSTPTCVHIQRPASGGLVSDTQIVNKLPPKNYGASETMNTGRFGPGNEERRSLLRFDLSPIPATQNGTTEIVSATVHLARGHLAATGPGTILVHRVTAPWSEGTVTWQSLPGN